MSSRRKLAIGLCCVALAACSEHARDETRVEPLPDNPPLIGVNAQRPAPAAPGVVPGGAEAPDSGPASTPVVKPPAVPAVPVNRDVDCQSGAERCNGARAERCFDGSWKLLQVCAQCNGASYCQVLGQGASCLAPFCCFPEARCADNRLLRCNQSSTAFDLVEDCGAGARCDAQSGACVREPADSGTGTE